MDWSQHIVGIFWAIISSLILVIGSTAAWTVKKVVALDKAYGEHQVFHQGLKEDLAELKDGQKQTRRAVDDLTLLVSARLK